MGITANKVGHEDRITLVDHLDELRTRAISSLIAFAAALALCFWQNHLLLEVVNAPLPEGRLPITFGVAEPFTTTLTVSAYGAILLALPVILYHAYAFALPALKPGERRAVTPFLIAAPALFVAGVGFAHFVVIPAATGFLLNFNASEFNIEIRAREYYSFFAMAAFAVGILFQIPVGVMAVTRLGIFTPQQIASNRRYAVLAIAVTAMLLPGTDPVTMLVSMAPLVALFEGSLLLARVFHRPREAPTADPVADPG
ncbi:MAG: twin-arginine translocase subunit TatC [Solirubrobacterales bacterium]